MVLLHSQVPISGKEGVVTVVIDGQVREWMAIKSLTGTVTLKKETWGAMGDRADRIRLVGWSGTGNLTYHYIDNIVTKTMLRYILTGKYPEISIVSTNNDPASSVGEQSIKLGAVIFDSAEITKLDWSSPALEGSAPFTFSEVEGLEIFDDL